MFLRQMAVALVTAGICCIGGSTAKAQQLYEVPGNSEVTVPLPLGHDRMETGGIYTSFEWVMLQQPKMLGSQVIAFRGFVDTFGFITRQERLQQAIFDNPGITPAELSQIQGSPGVFIGSGAPALSTDDFGRTTFTPGFKIGVGYRFDNGIAVSVNYLTLLRQTYRAGAGIVPPTGTSFSDNSDTFLFSPVTNFHSNYAGPPNAIEAFDPNDPNPTLPPFLTQGYPAGATYGIWNGATNMNIKYTQTFNEFDITARSPLFEGTGNDEMRVYALFGAQYTNIADRFRWFTEKYDAAGTLAPEFTATYKNTLDQRMYGVFMGLGQDCHIGNNFAVSVDGKAALLLNVVNQRARYELGAFEGPVSKWALRDFTVVPHLNVGANLWWYPLRGVQLRFGYNALAYFNTVAMEAPVGFNFGAIDPSYENKFVRFFHGFNAGVALTF